jgi:hypothetical protein
MAEHTIIVSGSRTWPWYKPLAAALDLELMRALKDGHLLAVRHGAATHGADQFTTHWCRVAHRHQLSHIREDTCPADWGTGHHAGLARNTHMTSLGADQVLAFLMRCSEAKCTGRPAHGTHGTTDLITKAARAGLPIHIFRDPSLPQIIAARKTPETQQEEAA